jgi:hypothetical protein
MYNATERNVDRLCQYIGDNSSLIVLNEHNLLLPPQDDDVYTCRVISKRRYIWTYAPHIVIQKRAHLNKYDVRDVTYLSEYILQNEQHFPDICDHLHQMTMLTERQMHKSVNVLLYIYRQLLATGSIPPEYGLKRPLTRDVTATHFKCPVCLEAEQHVVAVSVPCGHLICVNCTFQLRKPLCCSLCRDEVQYFSLLRCVGCGNQSDIVAYAQNGLLCRNCNVNCPKITIRH